ncbi:MAG: hypothetical protein ACI4SB_05230 [Acutalibacteraceae bacterium]
MQNDTRYDEEIEMLLKKFGRKMTMTKNGEDKEIFGFLQPLRYKNKMYLNGVTTELGYNTTRKYLLISAASVKLKEKDRENVIITASDGKYCCDHSETVHFGETECYCWSIVHRISD